MHGLRRTAVLTNEWAPPEAEDAYVVWDEDETLDPEAERPEASVPSFAVRSTPKHVDPNDPDGAKFLAILLRLKAERAARGTFDAGGKATVVLPSSPVADSDLPGAARAVMVRCRKAMWDVEAQQTRTSVSPLLFVGQTEKHNTGDLRTPAHEMVYFGIQGVLETPAGVAAAFWATWARKEVPGQKPGGNLFESAITWDPVEGRIPSAGATDFDEWLAIFAPKPKPQARRAKKETGA